LSVLIIFYISGHGFGHAARSIQVVNAIARREPSIRVALRTSVPEWFLRASLETPADILPLATDPGVVQPDSLSIDEDETARRAAAFYEDFEQRIADEAQVIRGLAPAIVLGDIPPLAFAGAAAAGVPSIAISNFTWDWIYEGFPGFDALAPGVHRTIADGNARASLALRLPFYGGFSSMRRVEDMPLVGRRATVARDETRRRLRLPGDRPVVLATFGGHGGNVPLTEAAGNGSFLLIATDYEVGKATPDHPNLRVVPARELRATSLTYTDLLAAADVVATKLGYGIVSECIANDVALLYTLRGRFREQDVFVREMPAVLRTRAIDREHLRRGCWGESIEALLAQPAPVHTMRADGADVTAARVVDALGR
jgi:hypothetical protein